MDRWMEIHKLLHWVNKTHFSLYESIPQTAVVQVKMILKYYLYSSLNNIL